MKRVSHFVPPQNTIYSGVFELLSDQQFQAKICPKVGFRQSQLSRPISPCATATNTGTQLKRSFITRFTLLSEYPPQTANKPS